MLDMGYKLFNKIYKRKYLAHHNHNIHFLHRELDDWLPKGIQDLKYGYYVPRHLERSYFMDGVVDQLHISDRIFQHIILHQIKSTFSHIINKNCYHLNGPHGVKLATQRIRKILQEQQPKYLIRADIKDFYSSIPHYKLIQDIQKNYNDPKLIEILKRIIRGHDPWITPLNHVQLMIQFKIIANLIYFYKGRINQILKLSINRTS